MAHKLYQTLNGSWFKKMTLLRLATIMLTYITEATVPVKTDRWLEIDLYWFEHKDMERSVTQFRERFNPLLDGINGWRGVILNVGWISDYVLEWHGDLNEKIQLPKSMKKYPWFKDEGQFAGNSTERIELWKDRFTTLQLFSDKRRNDCLRKQG